MRLAEDVKELGQIEQPPVLDGRNMVMVLGPTKNAGVKPDAKDEDSERGEEAVQADRGRQDLAPPAPPNDAPGAPDQEPAGEAEGRTAEQVGRA
jgi:hypothetical protein